MKTLGQLPMIVQADCGPIRDAFGHFRFTGSESRPGADFACPSAGGFMLSAEGVVFEKRWFHLVATWHSSYLHATGY